MMMAQNPVMRGQRFAKDTSFLEESRRSDHARLHHETAEAMYCRMPLPLACEIFH